VVVCGVSLLQWLVMLVVGCGSWMVLLFGGGGIR